MSFRYLQLCHAINTQFGDSIPSLDFLPLVEVITGQDPKKLISMFYNNLLLTAATTRAYKLKSRRVTDIEEIVDEECEEILDICKLVSPKLSDCLTHLYILHRSYLMPIRLSKYRPDHNQACSRCGEHRGTFYHLLWTCPCIQGYWTQVVKFLYHQMGSPLNQCLLGLLFTSEEEHLHTFL